MNNRKPELVVYAGPNGSGKSTFTSPTWIIGDYINADDIAKVLNCSVEEAALQADAMRHDKLDKRESFTFETVLSTDRNLKLMEEAKDAGYFIRGYFILTRDPSINIRRVAARVINNGHDVPVDKIVSRYNKSLKNLPYFISICDIAHVYDNTVQPILIYRKHNDKIGIYPNDLWNENDLADLLAFPIDA